MHTLENTIGKDVPTLPQLLMLNKHQMIRLHILEEINLYMVKASLGKESLLTEETIQWWQNQ